MTFIISCVFACPYISLKLKTLTEDCNNSFVLSFFNLHNNTIIFNTSLKLIVKFTFPIDLQEGTVLKKIQP